MEGVPVLTGCQILALLGAGFVAPADSLYSLDLLHCPQHWTYGRR
jgi:hypothetical protein